MESARGVGVGGAVNWGHSPQPRRVHLCKPSFCLLVSSCCFYLGGAKDTNKICSERTKIDSRAKEERVREERGGHRRFGEEEIMQYLT